MFPFFQSSSKSFINLDLLRSSAYSTFSLFLNSLLDLPLAIFFICEWISNQSRLLIQSNINEIAMHVCFDDVSANEFIETKGSQLLTGNEFVIVVCRLSWIFLHLFCEVVEE